MTRTSPTPRAYSWQNLGRVRATWRGGPPGTNQEKHMKKQIIVAVGLALSLAGAASAQQGGERGERPRRERGVEDSTRGARGARGERGRGPDGLLLKGITLTEGQRTQIAQLNKTQRTSVE